MKKIMLSTVAIAGLGLLTACSNHSSNPNALLNRVKEQKVLKVAVSPDYPPFEYQTIKDGKNQVVGADIDLANAIGKKLGVKVQIDTMDFNNVLVSLQTGRDDIAISGISGTSDRAKVFDFSDVYYDAANEVIVKKENADKYKSMTDFAGKKIGAQKGSVQETAVQQQLKGAIEVALPQTGDLINEVKSGSIDGAVVEDMIAKSYVRTNSGLALATVKIPNTKDNPGDAVALPKNSGALKTKVNEVIQELKSSGELDKIIQRNYEESQK